MGSGIQARLEGAILRVVDSSQLTATAVRFPGYTTIKPYLRKTVQPA
ncbi:MAG TPA: hypothetical protein VH482_33235 [Thermomicrobiales bacterium]|jgi:hypothetical protein